MSGLRNYFRIVASLQLLLSIVTVGGFVLFVGNLAPESSRFDFPAPGDWRTICVPT